MRDDTLVKGGVAQAAGDEGQVGAAGRSVPGYTVVKALGSPEVKERLASGGAQAIPSTPGELAARQKSELAIFRSVVAKSGMHVE